MKKLIMGVFLLLGTGLVTQTFAQTVVQTTTTTPSGTKYYYYSSSNVYNNPATGDYWYYDEPTTKWITVRTLPSTITVTDADRHEVYYSGTTPWRNNGMDKKKYRKVKKTSNTTKEKS